MDNLNHNIFSNSLIKILEDNNIKNIMIAISGGMIQCFIVFLIKDQRTV